MSSSLWLHGLHHARLPCPSVSPRVCSDSCPLSWWCHQTSVILCHPLFTPFILCHPLLLPSIFPSIRGFSNESALCIRWSKYWSFSISPSNKYLWLISFRIDWFDLLAVQGILKSLIEHHSLKASILRHSAFFSIQLSYLYTTTGNILALTVQTIVIQVISLLFNTLSRFVTAFLPRSKCLFNFMAAVTICSDFGAQENKICHCFHFSPLYALKWWDQMPWS